MLLYSPLGFAWGQGDSRVGNAQVPASVAGGCYGVNLGRSVCSASAKYIARYSKVFLKQSSSCLARKQRYFQTAIFSTRNIAMQPVERWAILFCHMRYSVVTMNASLLKPKPLERVASFNHLSFQHFQTSWTPLGSLAWRPNHSSDSDPIPLGDEHVNL